MEETRCMIMSVQANGEEGPQCQFVYGVGFPPPTVGERVATFSWDLCPLHFERLREIVQEAIQLVDTETLFVDEG